MTIDINEMRRLAQAATPGPWKVGQYLGSLRQFVIHTDCGDKGRGSDVAFTSAAFGNDETVANARFTAAVNPAAVIEILDRLEAAEKDVAIKEKVIDSLAAVVKRLDAQCDAAEKAITEAYRRGYAAGQEEITAELEFAKREVANLHDDTHELTDERDAYKAAHNEWIAKTEWVQDEITRGKLSAKYLGMHRADGIKVEIDALRANVERMEKIESAAQNLVKMKGRHNTEIAYRRLVATLEESK